MGGLILANRNQGMQKPIKFVDTLAAGESVTIPWMVEADCTLERITSKFYGSQHLLKVKIMHEKRGTQIANNVIDFLGDRDYMSGDFEEFKEDVTRTLQYKDYILIKATNDDIKENTVNVTLSVDFYGGGSRVIGG